MAQLQILIHDPVRAREGTGSVTIAALGLTHAQRAVRKIESAHVLTEKFALALLKSEIFERVGLIVDGFT
jgi:hypothetical protein